MIWFPSPVGDLYFSIKVKDMRNIKDSVSVPCRGLIFLNNHLNYVTDFLKFPSPVGDLYFSMGKYQRNKQNGKKFPSPVGDLYFSIFIEVLHNTSKSGRFPSPVGDLYFSIIRVISVHRQHINRFRPLSGTYISQSDRKFMKGRKNGFRPLSGTYISQ